MVLSLIVYTLSSIILYLLGRNIANRDSVSYRLYGRHKSFFTNEMFCIIAIFIVISGARYGVGSDHLTYLRMYLKMQNEGLLGRETFEPFFVFVMKGMALAGFHYFFFFAFWAFIQIFFLYYSLKDRKFLYPYLGLILMLSPLYITLMNGMRQATVACLFLFLCKYIKDRKFIYYLIGILIGVTIHKSALILLPLYFIFYKEYYIRNKYINIILVLICAIIGSLGDFSFFSNLFSFLFSLLDYDSYSNNLDSILVEMRSNSWGPIRLLLFITNISIIWFFPKVKECFKNDKFITLYFNFFLIGVCWSNLFANSYLLIRPALYLEIFIYILAAYILYYLKLNSKRMQFYYFSVLVYSYIYLSIIKVFLSGNSDSVIYYKFFFM